MGVPVDGQACGMSGDRFGRPAPCDGGGKDQRNCGTYDQPVAHQFTSILSATARVAL